MVRKVQIKLPIRERLQVHHGQTSQSTPEDLESIGLNVHTVSSRDGVIIRVQPPLGPKDSKPGHVPCDVVLVIDVSSSMQLPAPAKMNDDNGKLSTENFGLSILDLVKHAARTILASLDEGDRLGIVTFSREAKIVQTLLPMTPSNKARAHENITKMKVDSSTNLWHGIQKGVSVFEGEENTGRVPAVMILTDGQPNYMCPGQGYIPKMRSIWQVVPATIHTFGFGYDIRSGLLKSIAEFGGGNYAFIPDAGMIGTVFVHAVAHLQTTYATKSSLQVLTPNSIRLKTTAGKVIAQQEQKSEDGGWELTVNLGNLQYGQSRDIYLENVNGQDHKTTFTTAVGETRIVTNLTYSHMEATEFRCVAEKEVFEAADLPEYEVAYHRSRSMICDFLSSLFPLRKDGEYETRREVNPERHQADFQRLLNDIPARMYTDEYNKSLMEDLDGNLPSGQVKLALSSKAYFRQWGCHYFFSLWNAHAKQICNSFKDPGPLMYNRNPFFVRCRDLLDRSFDTIAPPKQTWRELSTTDHITMRSLNSSVGPCFASSSMVSLASGHQIPVRKLRRGLRVCTPVGTRRVVAILKTVVSEAAMCKIGDLVVTPWHPIKMVKAASEWSFPRDLILDLEQPRIVSYSGPIYSVLLQPGRDSRAHTIEIGGVWAVTLGHGIVRGNDVRAHQFLGDYDRVLRAIAGLQPGKDGVALSSGVQRHYGNGLVCGFRKYMPSQHMSMGSNASD